MFHALLEDPTYSIISAPEGTSEPVPVLRHVPGSTDFNTLNFRAPAVLLEFEDFGYHHDSAVTLPGLPSYSEQDRSEAAFWENTRVMQQARQSHPNTYDRFRNGQAPQPDDWETRRLRRVMVLIAVCYRFLERNPDYALVVAGHTDTSGDLQANFELSDLRARNVLSLLEGDADAWVSICTGRSKVEDVQRILKDCAALRGWDCDPGDVDNRSGPQTETAIRRFQAKYNEVFRRSIGVDGIAGRETWRAFFDLYMEDLAKLLQLPADRLGEARAQLRYVDSAHKYIGCGELYPIDEPRRDNFRSAENRRVEILFFHQRSLPDLQPHFPGGSLRSGSSGPDASSIYGSGAQQFAYLSPIWWDAARPGETYSPRFRIESLDETLTELHDDPGSTDYDTAHPAAPDRGSDADPWDFLDDFYDHFPGHGGARNSRSRLP